MILDWFKRIKSNFGLLVKSDELQSSKSIVTGNSTDLDRLENKISEIEKEKNKLILDDVSWFNISISKTNVRQSKIFVAYSIPKILTLKDLKEGRLEKEAKIKREKELKVRYLLDEAVVNISEKNSFKAKQLLDRAFSILLTLKSPELSKAYYSCSDSLDSLCHEIEKERLRKIAEQKKLEEERIRKESERKERERREKELRERKERERKEREYQRQYELARQREEKERVEKERLKKMSSIRKDKWEEFLQVLKDNEIDTLYHFTDVRNLPSIKRHGGLFSWKYCEEHNIKIPYQGGDDDSKQLDVKYGLQDYVRLSFCYDHPMAYRLEQKGCEIKILEIKIDVALLEGTLFSDINAADKLHTHGGSLEDLLNVNFEAVKRQYVRKDDPDFKPHQAEVMVKTFVPLEYIVNL